MTAKYIAIEGADGVGKSTVAKIVVELLKAKGFNVRLWAEPGGWQREMLSSHIFIRSQSLLCTLGVGPPKDPRLKLLLYLSSMIKHQPDFDDYDYIIGDRSILSTYVYQVSLDRVVSPEWLADTIRELKIAIPDSVSVIYGEQRIDSQADNPGGYDALIRRHVLFYNEALMWMWKHLKKCEDASYDNEELSAAEIAELIVANINKESV